MGEECRITGEHAEEAQPVGTGHPALPGPPAVTGVEAPGIHGPPKRLIGPGQHQAAAQPAGQVHQIGDPIVEHDHALVHLDHPVDQRRHLVEPVAGDQHSGRVLALRQQPEEDVPGIGVKVGGRLIHHQQLGVAPERDADQELLLLSARELDEGLAAHPAHIEPEAQRHGLDAPGLGPADPGGEGDELPHRHLEWRRELGHEADLGEDLLAVLPRVQPVDPHPPLTGVLPEQAADQGGLSSPIGAHQGDAVSTLDAEVDPLEDLLAAKALDDLLESNHRVDLVADRRGAARAPCRAP